MTANLNPEHRFLSDREVSELTGRGLQTLWNDRGKGQGLPYSKYGRLVRYRLADVLAYLEARKITPAE